METRIARILSFIFQPLLLPTYGFIILFNMKTFFSLVIPVAAKWQILGIIFVTTFILPALIILFLKYRGLISSLNMDKREERIIPFVVTTVFYYLAYYILKKLQISPIYYYFIIGTTFVIVITLIVNFFWKISIHMTAMGGLFGSFLGLAFVLMIDIPMLLITILLVSGLVGFARLRLNAHTPAQVYSGFLTGSTVMFLLFIFI